LRGPDFERRAYPFLMTGPAPTAARPPLWRGLFVGVLLGLGALLLFVRTEPAFEEVQQFRAWGSEAEVASWYAVWRRRIPGQTFVPEPPGRGPLDSAAYWIARGSHPLRVMRRGDRIVIATAGVDEQHSWGGGWVAFGEGRIEGPDRGFRGAVATVRWSCLSTQFRTASDGLARIRFDPDGRSLTALYVAHEAPTLYSKCYGILQEEGDTAPPPGAGWTQQTEGAPARGTLAGLIPMTAVLETLDRDASYDVAFEVVTPLGASIPYARVGLKGHPDGVVFADEAGRGGVRFKGRHAPIAQALAASAAGFFTGEYAMFAGDANPGLRPGGLAAQRVRIVLERLPRGDDPTYRWVHPDRNARPDDAMACSACHGWQYHQWIGSRHARMASNGLVAHSREALLARDPAAVDDCTGCHQPGHAASNPAGGWRPRGVLAAAHCDFCHKVSRTQDIRQSGVYGALQLARPDLDEARRPGTVHHVFGTSHDVSYAWMGASYSPAHASSFLCASCHQGGGAWREPGGVSKVSTFDEWRTYAAAEIEAGREARSCQSCHMPAGTTRALDGALVKQHAWDAMHRSPKVVRDHSFLGTEPDFAAAALDLQVTKTKEPDGRWRVDVRLRNVGAGHRVPTGTATKHVLVGVWARRGADRVPLQGADRLRLSEDRWLDPDPSIAETPTRTWDGAAGFVLGRVVSNETGVLRLASFHGGKEEGVVRDTRLAPGAERHGSWFAAPGAEPEVEVEVIHRRVPLVEGPQDATHLRGLYDAPLEVRWLRVVR